MKKVVPDSWAVPEAVRARIGTQIGRQRSVVEEGHAVLLLHQPPVPGERERRPAIFWRSPEGAWRSLPAREGLPALRAHLDAYSARLDALEAARARATSALAQGELLAEARPVARAARHLYDALQSLREAVPEDQDVIVARDRAYELARTADLCVEDAEAALELTVARRAEEQAALSERIALESRRLNLLAAVCLPITALGAVLGMNLPSGLDGWAGPETYWSVVGAAIVLGLVLTAWIRRLPERMDAAAPVGPSAAPRVAAGVRSRA